MGRDILLIEPGYKNKYPPIGLMKIASYHRILGDNIVFHKGTIDDFMLQQFVESCIKYLTPIVPIIRSETYINQIRDFLKSGHKTKLNTLKNLINLKNENSNWNIQIESHLIQLSYQYRNKDFPDSLKWDRVYITTLFTYYWSITVKTINEAKKIVKSQEELKVGGILASLLPKELEFETGIKPITGLLDKTGVLDKNSIVIDNLSLDYSILNEVTYNYPTGSAYFAYMTKGCTRKCSFCSVPVLEPIYKSQLSIKDLINETQELYGAQQNLLLMDNNVLASPHFSQIIQEIKDLGFVKGATFKEENQFEIALKGLEKNINDDGYKLKLISLFSELKEKNKKNDSYENICRIFEIYNINSVGPLSKENLSRAYKELKDIHLIPISKRFKKRIVDFNQGIDARYVNDSNMKLLSEIPIFPLRIAFDHWAIKNSYIHAVQLAAKYNIKRLSNYLLFNFNDTPIDLFRRMKINIDLSEELNIHIYSFPMKYIPLFGEEAKGRSYIGKNWNKKFVQAIQAIGNATRGIVTPGRSFFETSFGKTEEDFIELLYMPETMIIYRNLFENDLKLTLLWRDSFRKVKNNPELWVKAKKIIHSNVFNNGPINHKNKDLARLLSFYKITRNDVRKADKNLDKLKKKFNHLIVNDPSLELTITYDFD